MEENVTSMLLYMTNLNSLSDPTAVLRKVASHEPAGVARVEFVEYEAIMRRQLSSNGGSVSARCSNFIHQLWAGLWLKDRTSWRWYYASLSAGPRETNIVRARDSGSPPRWSPPNKNCGLITVSFASFFSLIHSMNACIGYSNIQSSESKKRTWTS